MYNKRSPQTPEQLIQWRIQQLEQKLKRIENDKALTAPLYDDSFDGFALAVPAVPGQIAIADPRVSADPKKAWAYDDINGWWQIGAVVPKGEFDIKIFGDALANATGDDKFIFAIPEDLDSTSLISAEAYITTVSSSGLVTVQIRQTGGSDMLSTPITIDVGETSSYTAATRSVVDGSFAVVATGDLISIDVDVAGTGAKGLGVILGFSA